MGKKKIKNYKVYIIGEIKSYNSSECIERFLQAKETLEKVGFVNIINPLEVDSNLTLIERKRSNLMQLVDANAVFILSNISVKQSNAELQIARYLNLVVIHDHK